MFWSIFLFFIFKSDPLARVPTVEDPTQGDCCSRVCCCYGLPEETEAWSVSVQEDETDVSGTGRRRENKVYRNDPKFSDKQVWANSVDEVQTVPKGAFCESL